MTQPAPPHPIRDLAHAHLKERGVSFWPAIHPNVLAEAVARYGMGPDYPAGELVIAHLSFELPRGYTASYLVTDRRLFGRVHASNVPDTIYEVPFAYVTDVRTEGSFLTKKVAVALGPRSIKLPVFVDPLERFFRAMLSIPPPYRSFPPLAVAQTPEDPTGAWSANQQILSRDPRIALVLRVVYERSRAGELAQLEGFEVVMRALVLDRTIAMGRGSRGPTWLSLIPRAELAAVFHALLGETIGAWRDPATETYDFLLARAGSGGGALASSALGLALFAAVGVGWVSFARSSPSVRTVRVVLNDMPPVTGMTLLGSAGSAQFQPLSTMSPGLTLAIAEPLTRIESRLLLLQATFGLTAPPGDLLSYPRSTLDQHLAARVGPTDLSGFYPT